MNLLNLKHNKDNSISTSKSFVSICLLNKLTKQDFHSFSDESHLIICYIVQAVTDLVFFLASTMSPVYINTVSMGINAEPSFFKPGQHISFGFLEVDLHQKWSIILLFVYSFFQKLLLFFFIPDFFRHIMIREL